MEQTTGKLSLVLCQNEKGDTYLAQQYFKLPLQVMRVHYQDQDGTAFVYLLNPSGGILQGDRLLTEITLQTNSKALITTPSTTKFYRMDEGYAKVQNQITLEKGAVLEYLPEHTTPFAQSTAYQENDFYLDQSSILIATDMVTAGRVSRGECFHYNLYASRTRIYVDGKLRVYDNSRMEPAVMEMGALGLMEGYLTHGTIYVYAPEIPDELVQNLNQLPCGETIRFAAGKIDDNLMIIRFLGNNIIDLKTRVQTVWHQLRPALLGKEAVRIRKY